MEWCDSGSAGRRGRHPAPCAPPANSKILVRTSVQGAGALPPGTFAPASRSSPSSVRSTSSGATLRSALRDCTQCHKQRPQHSLQRNTAHAEHNPRRDASASRSRPHDRRDGSGNPRTLRTQAPVPYHICQARVQPHTNLQQLTLLYRVAPTSAADRHPLITHDARMHSTPTRPTPAPRDLSPLPRRRRPQKPWPWDATHTPATKHT